MLHLLKSLHLIDKNFDATADWRGLPRHGELQGIYSEGSETFAVSDLGIGFFLRQQPTFVGYDQIASFLHPVFSELQFFKIRLRSGQTISLTRSNSFFRFLETLVFDLATENGYEEISRELWGIPEDLLALPSEERFEALCRYRASLMDGAEDLTQTSSHPPNEDPRPRREM